MLLNFLVSINGFLWNNIVLWLLLFSGLFFSIYLRFIQARFFIQSIRTLFQSTRANKQRISSFQALCTSLAQRVGTGNLAGVATALTHGGEGAIFWMWMTAILGSSTAYAESTLAQVFKLNKADGSFFGGPAYYIHAGLRLKPLAMVFSFSLVIALGFVFNGVQSNTIAQGLAVGFNAPPLACGIGLSFLTALIIFGGKQRMAKVAEVLVPIMALSYLGMTLYVMVIHYGKVPALLQRIVTAAFSSEAVLGGMVGHTMKEAFRYGVARGLFSNEAGFGSAPNAAASADVEHPSQQGLVQMVAVYIDTLLICTSTAALILLAGDLDPSLTGIALTQAAASFHFGAFGKYFVGVAIILFGFTTILGNTFYGEANIQFLSNKSSAIYIFRLLVIAVVVTGAILEVPIVWEVADLMSATMIMINLTSVVTMADIVKRTTSHFERFSQDQHLGFSFGQIGLSPHGIYDFAFREKNASRECLAFSAQKPSQPVDRGILDDKSLSSRSPSSSG